MNPIALDYETSAGGTGSPDYFREDFQVDSVALTWRQDGALKSVFYDTPRQIRKALKALSDTQKPIIVHNYQFEVGVTNACFPDLNLNFQFDTMRMCFLRDGKGDGGKNRKKDEYAAFMGKSNALGVSLEKCAKRYLPRKYHNHKEEAHKWIETNLGVKKYHGRYLDRLPRDIFERYNIADTEITYLLWEDCQEFFDAIGYSDRTDWQLYAVKKRLDALSFRRGFPIDRQGLLEYIIEREAEVGRILDKVREALGQETLDKYEDLRIERAVSKLKTEKGKENARKRLKESGEMKPNVNAGPQWSEMLVLYHGIKPVKFTDKGKPSTGKDHLWQWGEVGKILQNKNKLKHALSQAVGIYLASERDGYWHPEIKPYTTVTNRIAGGSDYD